MYQQDIRDILSGILIKRLIKRNEPSQSHDPNEADKLNHAILESIATLYKHPKLVHPDLQRFLDVLRKTEPQLYIDLLGSARNKPRKNL